jgi:Xaa-Pro aminopeptidase
MTQSVFQTFEVRGDPTAAESHLPLLRERMKVLDIDGLLLPHDDEYLNEYTPPHLERLLWATGFSGSAGSLIVMPDSAVLFIDGRYKEQAKLETPAEHFDYEDLRALPPWQWLRDNPGRINKLGYCSRLHSQAEIARIEAIHHIVPIALETHPADDCWTNRPKAVANPPYAHGIEYSGESSTSKRRRVGEEIARAGADTIIFASPDATAWLLNIRGNDVPHTPVALCRTVLHADGSAAAFFAGHEITEELRNHLGPDVRVYDEHQFGSYLGQLGADRKAVLVNKENCPKFVFDILVESGAVLREGDDPLALLRSVKNAVEVEGFRNAHVRDGLAIVKFLCWLDENWMHGISEIDAVKKLEGFRAEDEAMQDISFDTISGSGPNGAIIHYRVSEASNRRLREGELLLVDSGAQYFDGTTDITRTVALGDQPDVRRDRFTRVLQGHIALASARFPTDTSGYQLDILARQPLWNAGLDYAHGTGHGVGAFLGVHEGPQSIAKRGAFVPLRPGMVLSNEPGYYVDGDYGIRIENLVVVRECGDNDMLEFETLTLAPIDRSLVDMALLSGTEISWINDYHARVRERLTPLLGDRDAAWLERATAALRTNG